MTYTLVILRRAQRELADLPMEAYPRVREAIRKLGEDPRPTGCMKLSGRDGWRIRVGSYRVIYEIDDAQRQVTILHIGHRREVYRQLAAAARGVHAPPDGRCWRVFCASMADVFDNQAPPGQRKRLWALSRATPNLEWRRLTQRPQTIMAWLPPDWGEGYPNVRLGVTVENPIRAPSAGSPGG